MKATLQKITPTKAKQWLAKNKRNRRLRRNQIDRHVATLRAGAWKVNGETIKINCDGGIIDGQHRLHAVKESGCTMNSYVITGLPANTFDTIDTGLKRTLTDALTYAGHERPGNLATAARGVVVVKSGKMDEFFRRPLSNASGVKFVRKHKPELLDAVLSVKEWDCGLLMSSGLAASALFCFREKNRKAADAFMERLGTGEDVPKGSDISKLRRWLTARRKQRIKIAREHLLYMLISCWNASRSKEHAFSTRLPDSFQITIV